jgi:hypothetical protein
LRLLVERGEDPAVASERITALSHTEVHDLLFAQLVALPHRSDDEEELLALLTPARSTEPDPPSPQVDPAAVVRALWEAGILPEPPEVLLREPFARDDPRQWFTAVTRSSAVVRVDAETGFVPVQHTELLSDLIAATGGRLAPDRVAQQVDGDGTTLTATWGSLVVERFPEDLGDWFDVACVLDVAEALLEGRGLPERFVSLEDDGGAETLLFADPERLRPIARAFALPLHLPRAESSTAEQVVVTQGSRVRLRPTRR